jgi:hypothetical protein
MLNLSLSGYGRLAYFAGRYRSRQLHALVKDRHRNCEFIILKLIDAAYPTHTAIKLILDNHSAHISKETRALISPPWTMGPFGLS